MTMTATKTLNTIRTVVESIKNDEPQRFSEAASVGDIARQGDVYVEKLASVPPNATRAQKPNPQLAPGTTQGSRHVLDSFSGVEIYSRANATPLDGPVLLTTEERTITHPEHGDVILPPGCYGVTYQRMFADELRRQQD